MADIFGYRRDPKPRGVFSTEDSILTFGQGDSLGYLVQSWNVSYQQQVQELFEIGSNALYWAKGRPAGQGTISRVIGEKGPKGFFPQQAYDICDGGASINLNAKGGACAGQLPAGVQIFMDGVVITNIGFSMQVADVRLIENFGWRFAFMDVS